MPDREWWSALWPDPEGVLRKLGVPRGETSVDLCSGDGYFTAPLSRLVAPGRVYALEIDPEMVERAREYLAVCGGGNCVVIEDDASRLAAQYDLNYKLIQDNPVSGILSSRKPRGNEGKKGRCVCDDLALCLTPGLHV